MFTINIEVLKVNTFESIFGNYAESHVDKTQVFEYYVSNFNIATIGPY